MFAYLAYWLKSREKGKNRYYINRCKYKKVTVMSYQSSPLILIHFLRENEESCTRKEIIVLERMNPSVTESLRWPGAVEVALLYQPPVTSYFAFTQIHLLGWLSFSNSWLSMKAAGQRLKTPASNFELRVAFHFDSLSTKS